MAAPALYNGLKASPVEFCLFVGNIVYVLPTPTAISLNQNITERIQLVSSQTGEEVIANTYVSGQQPELTVTFPSLIAETIGLKTGRAFEIKDVDSFYTKKLVVPASGLIPAVTAGFDGFGIVADAPSNASVLRDGASVQLVQVIGAFTPSTAAADTFSVGASRALEFSLDDTNSLVGQNVIVKIPESLSDVLVLGEAPFINFGIIATFVDVNLGVWRMVAPSVTVNLTASGNLDFGAEGVEVTFRITYDGSTCTPWDITRTNRLTKC